MLRSEMAKHVETCKHITTVSCKYRSLGCCEKAKRCDMIAHEQDKNLHLGMALDTIGYLQQKVMKLEWSLEKNY